MYCSQCGSYNADSSKFCTQCGSLLQKTVKTDPVKVVPDPVRKVNEFGVVPGFGKSKETVKQKVNPKEVTFPAVKDVAMGGLFLTAIICYCIGILFTVIQMDDTAVALKLAGYKSGSVDTMIFFQWICVLCNVVTAAGLWCTYGFARASEEIPMNTTGIKIIKISQIVYVIVNCINMFITISAAMDSLRVYGIEGDGILIFIALLVVAAIGTMWSMHVRAMNIATATMETGIPDSRISKTIAILLIVAGALSSFSLLTAFSLATLASAVSSILFGCVMLQYRSKMEWAEAVCSTY